MKINQPTEKPVVVSSNAAAQGARSAPTVSAQAQSSATASARSVGVAVTVSTLARTLEANSAADLPEVDLKKVQSVRAAIADGSYVVNPGVIADKLLANAQEMLQHQRI